MIIAGKLRKTSTFNIPTVFTDEYLAKDHEFHMTDCKSYLMKDNDDINNIGGASVEFEHILQSGFDNDKKKSNGKMYVFDVKSGSNIINKMAEKFTDMDIVER